MCALPGTESGLPDLADEAALALFLVRAGNNDVRAERDQPGYCAVLITKKNHDEKLRPTSDHQPTRSPLPR